jgi:glycosyltransferase involved in cell wall biosynthesis
MRIAYCIPRIDGTGGLERVLCLKANYFAEDAGYEVFIIVTESNDKPLFYQFSPKIRIINLDINFEELWRTKFLKRIIDYSLKQKKYKKALSTCLKKIKPDITISVLRREINFINSIKDGSIKIGEFHFNKDNYRDYKKSIRLDFLRNLANKWGMKQLVRKLKKLTRFVVLSYEDMQKWTELNNVTVIHNPLAFFPNKIASLDKKEVIAIGRYTYQKGFDLLMEAWKIVHEKHPDWNLNIYGGGDTKELFSQIQDLKLESCCRLNPPVPNIEEKYLESSIFVLSSRYEGFGMVISEAMACGVPAVSFACPCGPKDIIRDEEDGLLVEPENIQELAQKIIYLIDHKDIRIEMGHKAKISAERFKIDKIMDQWKELFESLVSPKVEKQTK